MYRLIHSENRQELPLRMLFHPVGERVYLRACEADGFRGLVAALLDDPSYEEATAATRLLARIRLAEDAKLVAAVGGQSLAVGDRAGAAMINVASDEPLIRSLDQVGFVSLPPREGRGLITT